MSSNDSVLGNCEPCAEMRNDALQIASMFSEHLAYIVVHKIDIIQTVWCNYMEQSST
jgi:hypothetical protein